jgi:hypothetical protein
MVTETKESRLDVVLPDLGEVVADIIQSYEKKLTELYPDSLISNEQANSYAHLWLEMMFERGKKIHAKREYDLASYPSENNKSTRL